MVRLAPSRPTPSAPVPPDGLPLPLQSALNSLNVQVEQELARYRQSRRGEIPEARSDWMKGRQPLELIPVPPVPKAAIPPVVAPVAAPPVTAAPGVTSPLSDPVRSAPFPGEPEAIREPRTALFQTPLGVGLFLLLGVGGIGLGIAAANPATLSPILARLAPYWPTWGTNPEVATAEGDTLEPGTEPTANTDGDSPSRPLEPDLSRREFTPLDLSSLSTLPSRLSTRPIPSTLPREGDLADAETETVDPTAIAPVTPVAPSTPVAPPAAVPPAAAPERLAATTPRPATPAPTPSRPTSIPTPSNANAPSSPAPARFFYVVMDFTGDASLDQARQVVGDAYVRNFPVGARIQVGAFSSQKEATAAAERLQQQGLTVEVYQP